MDYIFNNNYYEHRYFFWTDWGLSPRIERASMDGKERVILHSDHLAWPNALTIDFATQTLYWADAKLLVIESSSIYGTNRRPIRTENLRHPFAMSMFEDELYWTDWQSKSIYSTDKFARTYRMRQITHYPYATHQEWLDRNGTVVSLS